MSSIWTPGGERPVRREPEEPAVAVPGSGPGSGLDDGQEPTPEQVQAQMAALQEQLASTPAGEVVANHCFGLFELAALHLSLQPPQLGEASVAIDALTALVDALPGRLGEHEGQLKEGLASLKLAFVQIRAANLGTAEPPPS
ncbi:MAG TPA: hypothetical protein VM933_00715 [Acidimicrobiales bacterium]|nr:hypothetical protein [Acidimicrobiales bacterium]